MGDGDVNDDDGYFLNCFMFNVASIFSQSLFQKSMMNRFLL